LDQHPEHYGRESRELLQQQVLARAELANDRAKLADFEERVRETEDLWGQPFQRGRAIIQRTRATIERRERIYWLLDQAAEAYDAGDEERAWPSIVKPSGLTRFINDAQQARQARKPHPGPLAVRT
jgi:hypothetical protein